MNEVRPEDVQYPAMLRRIREQLDEGLTVYVDHCEFSTSKKLVIVRAEALTREGAFPPVYADYLFIGWLYTGSMWYVPHASWDYIADKIGVHKWPGDAKSIAAFMSNILNVGTGKPLIKAGDL